MAANPARSQLVPFQPLAPRPPTSSGNRPPLTTPAALERSLARPTQAAASPSAGCPATRRGSAGRTAPRAAPQQRRRCPACVRAARAHGCVPVVQCAVQCAAARAAWHAGPHPAHLHVEHLQVLQSVDTGPQPAFHRHGTVVACEAPARHTRGEAWASEEGPVGKPQGGGGGGMMRAGGCCGARTGPPWQTAPSSAAWSQQQAREGERAAHRCVTKLPSCQW